MRRIFTKLIGVAAIAVPLLAGAQAGGGHSLGAVADARAPHSLVIREQGWDSGAGVARDLRELESGTSADFAILSAREALARRRAGMAVKVVYVLSRAADEFQVLAVSERTLSSEPLRVEGVVAAYERARRWMVGDPEANARLLAAAGRAGLSPAQAGLGGRDYNVARPGPALLQVLKAGSAGTGIELETLLDDTAVRAAVRSLQRPTEPTLLSRL